MAALSLQETREAQAAESVVAKTTTIRVTGGKSTTVRSTTVKRATTRSIPGCRNRLIAVRDRHRTRRKAAAGRNFLPAPTTVQAPAAVQITVQQLIMIQAPEFPLLTALTMRRRATPAEIAGLRWICIGLS
jgi:hypothetical protein